MGSKTAGGSAGPTLQFSRLSRRRASDEVAGALQSALATGQIAHGDRFPSENELAASFQTSRATVREALRILESMGLVEIRSGAGTFALDSPFNGAELPERLQWLARRLDDVIEMLEVREVLQGRAAYGCATDAGKATRDALQAHLAALAAAVVARDLDGLAEADARFHMDVAEGCGNSMLQQLCDYVEQVYRTSNRVLVDLRLTQASSALVEEHQAIVDRILDRDPAGAEAAMRSHIGNVRIALESVERSEDARRQ